MARISHPCTKYATPRYHVLTEKATACKYQMKFIKKPKRQTCNSTILQTIVVHCLFIISIGQNIIMYKLPSRKRYITRDNIFSTPETFKYML